MNSYEFFWTFREFRLSDLSTILHRFLLSLYNSDICDRISASCIVQRHFSAWVWRKSSPRITHGQGVSTANISQLSTSTPASFNISTRDSIRHHIAPSDRCFDRFWRFDYLRLFGRNLGEREKSCAQSSNVLDWRLTTESAQAFGSRKRSQRLFVRRFRPLDPLWAIPEHILVQARRIQSWIG